MTLPFMNLWILTYLFSFFSIQAVDLSSLSLPNDCWQNESLSGVLHAHQNQSESSTWDQHRQLVSTDLRKDQHGEIIDRYNSLFESVNVEVSPPVQVETEGTIPSWLHGVFLRNGPGSWQLENKERVLEGWIDGFAKLDQWIVTGGYVKFGTKFVRSAFFNRSHDGLDIPYTLGLIGDEDPPFDKVDLIQAVLSTTDNTNINLWQYANDTIAVTGDFHVRDLKVHPITLETSAFHFQGIRKLMGGRSSHPQHAVGNTDVSYLVSVPFLAVPGLGYHMCLVEVKSHSLSGRPERKDVACQWIPRMTNFHSLGVSQNYAILYDSPLSADVDMLQVVQGNISLRLGWNPLGKTRILLTRLDGRSDFQEVTLPTDAYCGHAVQTWEEDTGVEGEIFLVSDWECVDGKRIVWLLSGCRPHRFCSAPAQDSDFFPSVWRFRIRLRESSRGLEVLEGGLETKFQESSQDYPSKSFYSMLMRSNYDNRGRPYCYYYSFGIRHESHDWFITKTNLCLGQVVDEQSGYTVVESKHWSRRNHVPTEPIFVARPGATDEDDGVLLSSVHDTENQKTYLAVYDARNLTLLSKSYAPIQSMFGLHGRFFDFDRRTTY